MAEPEFSDSEETGLGMEEQIQLILAIVQALKGEIIQLRSMVEHPGLAREDREADMTRIEDGFNDLVKTSLAQSVFR